MLRKLRGTLNVAQLRHVCEDDREIHILMEHCSGGELCGKIEQRNYSERTVCGCSRGTQQCWLGRSCP